MPPSNDSDCADRDSLDARQLVTCDRQPHQQHGLGDRDRRERTGAPVRQQMRRPRTDPAAEPSTQPVRQSSVITSRWASSPSKSAPSRNPSTGRPTTSARASTGAIRITVKRYVETVLRAASPAACGPGEDLRSSHHRGRDRRRGDEQRRREIRVRVQRGLPLPVARRDRDADHVPDVRRQRSSPRRPSGGPPLPSPLRSVRTPAAGTSTPASRARRRTAPPARSSCAERNRDGLDAELSLERDEHRDADQPARPRSPGRSRRTRPAPAAAPPAGRSRAARRAPATAPAATPSPRPSGSLVDQQLSRRVPPAGPSAPPPAAIRTATPASSLFATSSSRSSTSRGRAVRRNVCANTSATV